MTYTEAMSLLELTQLTGPQQLKNQYRLLMRRYHPDVAAGSDPGIAQTINEAYELLKKESVRSLRREEKRIWKAKENPCAYCERNIYLSGEFLSGHAEDRYCIARGRYEWDPNQEDFDMFLYSLNQAVGELLGFGETALEISYRASLLYLLSLQFVDGIGCLRSLYEADKKEPGGAEIYRFKASVAASADILAHLEENDPLYPKCVRQNRLIVQDRSNTEVGSVSFEENQLYFIIIPILKFRSASLRLRVKEIHCKKYGGYIKLYFDIKINKEKENKLNLNKSIEKLIYDYKNIDSVSG